MTRAPLSFLSIILTTFFLLGYHQLGETMPVDTAEVETANGKVFRNTTSVQVNFKAMGRVWVNGKVRIAC